MQQDGLLLRRSLRAITVGAAGLGLLVGAIALGGGGLGVAVGTTAAPDATSSATGDASSSDASTSDASSTDDAMPPIAPPLAPIRGVDKYTVIETELTVKLSCSVDQVVDGKVPVTIVAENQDNGLQTVETFDIAKNGKLSFGKPTDVSIDVTATWTLPASVKPATGLVVRAACSQRFEPGNKDTFAEVSTNVVKPINKYVNATFPKTVKQGDKVTFDVECTRSAFGAFTLRNSAGKEVLYSTTYQDADESDGVIKTSTDKGFKVEATVPAASEAGDYTVEFECSAAGTDVVLPWKEEAPAEAIKSPLLPIGILAAKLPDLL